MYAVILSLVIASSFAWPRAENRQEIVHSVFVEAKRIPLLKDPGIDERQEIFRREISQRRDLNLVTNPNLAVCERRFVRASICSAMRLFACFVLSRISSPFQTNLYRYRFEFFCL